MSQLIRVHDHTAAPFYFDPMLVSRIRTFPGGKTLIEFIDGARCMTNMTVDDVAILAGFREERFTTKIDEDTFADAVVAGVMNDTGVLR